MGTENNKASQAIGLFNNHYNCAQSVFTPFAMEKKLDEDTALKITCGLGAGIGRMARICGAVTGGCLVLGMYFGKGINGRDEDKNVTYELVRSFTARFQDQFGSIQCKDLINCDISTEDGMTYAKEHKLFEIRCTELVAGSVRLLEELI